ncbi:MAG: tetratricopeptide repeat protein, partial [Candidatus Paceibacterota bacterium]
PNWVKEESAILMASDKGKGMGMDLWMSGSKGEEILRLTSTAASESYPGFASKTGQIFFASDKTFNTHLWKIDYIKTRTSNMLGELSEKISKVAMKEGIQNIGIFGLSNYSMLGNDQLTWIQDHLAHKVINEGTLNVVDRSHLDRILEELNYNQSDMVDPDKRLEVGEMAQVEAFVHGGMLDFVHRNKQSTLIYLKLIEAGTSEVIWSYLGTAKGNPNPLFLNEVKSKLAKTPDTFSISGERKRINVLALWKNQSSSISEKYLDYITEYGLLEETSFKISDRSSLKYILREKGLRYEGLIDPNKTAQLKVLPVEGILFGKILRDNAGNTHYFLKILDVEDGSLLWSTQLKIAKDSTRLGLLNKIVDRVVGKGSDSGNGMLDKVEEGDTVSVLPIENRTSLSAQVLEDLILNELLKNREVRVINREIIQRYLSEEREQGKQLGLDKVAKIGEQVGIDIFLDLKLNSAGETYATGLIRAIDVETAKYLASTQFRTTEKEAQKCANIKNYYEEMEGQMRQGSYRSATKIARNILSMLSAQCKDKRDEYYQRTLRSLGIAQYYLNNYRRAKRRLQQHISSVGTDGTTPSALYCLGDIRYRQNQYQQAEKLLKAAVNMDKNFFEAYARLGDLYRKTESYRRAITSYDNIPSKSDIYGKILIKKALTYEEYGNSDKAEELYREATGYESVKESAYRNLGTMYYNRALQLYKEDKKYKAEERFKQAEEYFNEVLAMNSKAEMAYQALKNIYSKLDVPKSWNKAIELVKKKEKSLGATSKDYFLVGQMHLKFYKKYYEEREREKYRERMRKAKDVFKKALKRDEMDGLLTDKQKEIIHDVLQD